MGLTTLLYCIYSTLDTIKQSKDAARRNIDWLINNKSSTKKYASSSETVAKLFIPKCHYNLKLNIVRIEPNSANHRAKFKIFLGRIILTNCNLLTH